MLSIGTQQFYVSTRKTRHTIQSILCNCLKKLHMRFTRDFRGILHFSFIVAYWLYGTLMTSCLIVIPHWQLGHLPTWQATLFWLLCTCCLISLMRATFSDPGFAAPTSVELYCRKFKANRQPEMSYCERCETRRPARAHHCRRCGRCVLRMDHHCPWINNCVGEANQWCFNLLLFYAFFMSCAVLHFVRRELWNSFPLVASSDEPNWIDVYRRPILYSLLSLSVLMILASVLLLTIQQFTILLDKTTLEILMDIYERGKSHVGIEEYRNREASWDRYAATCGYHYPLVWLLPCLSRRLNLIDDEIIALSKINV